MPEVKNHLTPDMPEYETANIHTSLGIADDRAKQLCDMLNEVDDKTETFGETIAEASKHTQTNEELAYVCFQIGACAQSMKAKHDLLSRILGDK